MREGLLWLDADKKRDITQKIIAAADHYRRKFGVVPDLCYVNAGQLERPLQVGRLRAVPAPYVLKHHFWVGVKDD